MRPDSKGKEEKIDRISYMRKNIARQIMIQEINYLDNTKENNYSNIKEV